MLIPKHKTFQTSDDSKLQESFVYVWFFVFFTLRIFRASLFLLNVILEGTFTEDSREGREHDDLWRNFRVSLNQILLMMCMTLKMKRPTDNQLCIYTAFVW